MTNEELLKTLVKICNHYGSEKLLCEGCPMHDLDGWNCFNKATVEMAENWRKEHPVKTYTKDFLEKFPKAEMAGGYPSGACRKKVYGGSVQQGKACFDEFGIKNPCVNCWAEEMEDEE